MKKRMKNILLMMLAMAAGMSIGGASTASSITYLLDQSNALDDGIDYLEVMIDDEGAAGDINFTVTTLAPLADNSGGNYGIQAFGFNGSSVSAANIVFGGAASSGWTVAHNRTMSEFGSFMNRLSGRGWNRADPLTFSISGIDGDTIDTYAALSSGGNSTFFSAHVAGFSIGSGCEGGDESGGDSSSHSSGRRFHGAGHGDDEGCDAITSAYFGGSTEKVPPAGEVPVPAAAWTFGSGLLAMAGIIRRKAV